MFTDLLPMTQESGEVNTMVVNNEQINVNQSKTFHTDNGLFTMHYNGGGNAWGVGLVKDGVFSRLDNDSDAHYSYDSTTQILTMYQTYTNGVYLASSYNDLG